MRTANRERTTNKQDRRRRYRQTLFRVTKKRVQRKGLLDGNRLSWNAILGTANGKANITYRCNLVKDDPVQELGKFPVSLGRLVHKVSKTGKVVVAENRHEQVAMVTQSTLLLCHSHVPLNPTQYTTITVRSTET